MENIIPPNYHPVVRRLISQKKMVFLLYGCSENNEVSEVDLIPRSSATYFRRTVGVLRRVNASSPGKSKHPDVQLKPLQETYLAELST